MALWQKGAGKPPGQYLERSSGLSSSGIAKTGTCLFDGFTVKTNGVNDITVTFYDNTSASGTVLPPGASIVIPGAERIASFKLPGAVKCDNGIYVVISGTGGTVFVFFDA